MSLNYKFDISSGSFEHLFTFVETKVIDQALEVADTWNIYLKLGQIAKMTWAENEFLQGVLFLIRIKLKIL